MFCSGLTWAAASRLIRLSASVSLRYGGGRFAAFRKLDYKFEFKSWPVDEGRKLRSTVARPVVRQMFAGAVSGSASAACRREPPNALRTDIEFRDRLLAVPPNPPLDLVGRSPFSGQSAEWLPTTTVVGSLIGSRGARRTLETLAAKYIECLSPGRWGSGLNK